MLDIIRFQFRQLLRTRVVHLANLLMLGTFFLLLILDSGNHSDVRPAMTDYLPQTLPQIAAMVVFAPALMVGMVCGDDFADKTINHELTAGRSRAASYFGRAVPVMIAAPLTAAAVMAIPYVIYGAMFGVGDAIPVSYIVQRFLLMLFPLLRLCAFCIFLLFVTKKQLSAGIAAMLAASLGIAVFNGEATAPIIKVILKFRGMVSMSDLIELTQFHCWRAYDLTGQNFYTYYPALPASEIAQIVGFSLLICAVWLLLGYRYFHVDDMN